MYWITCFQYVTDGSSNEAISANVTRRITQCSKKKVRNLESLASVNVSLGGSRHFCIALAMSGYGLKASRLSAISSLAGLRIETTIGTTFCVSGDQKRGTVIYRIP